MIFSADFASFLMIRFIYTHKRTDSYDHPKQTLVIWGEKIFQSHGKEVAGHNEGDPGWLSALHRRRL